VSAVARRYYRRGRTALERNDLPTAVESLSAAIDLVPTFASARVAYAVALSRHGDHPRAAQVLRAGLARPGSKIAHASLWSTLGDVLAAGGDFLGAEDAFSQAAQTEGYEARVAAGMARVHAKLGRYPEAFAELRKVAALSSADSADEA
jgi:tetratricopeptide (TPR) repeat protein